MYVPSSNDGALPIVTFNDRLALHLNNHGIAATHYSNAHSDSDIVIHFRNANVMHMGDIWTNGRISVYRCRQWRFD